MEQEMRFSKCKVHFIYSFLVNLQSRYPFTNNSLVKQPGENQPIQRLYRILGKESKNGEWKDHKPNNRFGVTTNMATRGIEGGIYYERGPEDYSIIRSKNKTFVNVEEPVNIKLTNFIRINDSGSSTITITICPTNSSIEVIDIHRIYGLVGINANEDPEFYLLKDGDSNEKKTLFSIFLDFVNKIEKAVSGQCEPFTNENTNYFVLDNKIKPKFTNEEWRRIRGREYSEWQNPFVLTELTISKKFDRNEPPPWLEGHMTRLRDCVTGDGYSNVHQELITIWARFLKGRELLESNEHWYVKPVLENESVEFPRNYSWHKDVFIGFHGRGGTVIQYSDSRKSAIVQELTESYLDLLETLRARWHLCVVFGELISEDLNYLNYLISLPEDRIFDFTERIVQRREMFIRFLSDQTMYAFEGGVVSEICRKAREDLYVDALTNAVKDKFAALERYFRECVDLRLNERMKGSLSIKR